MVESYTLVILPLGVLLRDLFSFPFKFFFYFYCGCTTAVEEFLFIKVCRTDGMALFCC